MDDRTRELLDRIRPSLSGAVRERPMFGVVAVMVDDAMVVAAHRDGSLLVRVDPADDARLMRSPDASRLVMGRGRTMGVGWILVSADAVASDEGLAAWLEPALRFREASRSG